MSTGTASNGLEHFDKLPARSLFRPAHGNFLGIIATVALIAIALIMFIPITARVLKGDYYESIFERYKLPDTTLNSPYDVKLAVVFRNKTTGLVVDHATIAKDLFVKSFWGDNEFGYDSTAVLERC